MPRQRRGASRELSEATEAYQEFAEAVEDTERPLKESNKQLKNASNAARDMKLPLLTGGILTAFFGGGLLGLATSGGIVSNIMFQTRGAIEDVINTLARGLGVDEASNDFLNWWSNINIFNNTLLTTLAQLVVLGVIVGIVAVVGKGFVSVIITAARWLLGITGPITAVISGFRIFGQFLTRVISTLLTSNLFLARMLGILLTLPRFISMVTSAIFRFVLWIVTLGRAGTGLLGTLRLLRLAWSLVIVAFALAGAPAAIAVAAVLAIGAGLLWLQQRFGIFNGFLANLKNTFIGTWNAIRIATVNTINFIISSWNAAANFINGLRVGGVDLVPGQLPTFSGFRQSSPASATNGPTVNNYYIDGRGSVNVGDAFEEVLIRYLERPAVKAAFAGRVAD